MQGMTGTLDPMALERLRPLIELELRRRLLSPHPGGEFRFAAVLLQIFIHLCGAQRSREERQRFLSFAAPIAREVATACAAMGFMLEELKLELLEFNRWFHGLQSFDPICTRMVELCYFGGLSARETAVVLNIAPQMVISELRFAKAWWSQTRMRRRC